jgi:hypothetical protein
VVRERRRLDQQDQPLFRVMVGSNCRYDMLWMFYERTGAKEDYCIGRYEVEEGR